nr:hypothetical protein SHINE37_41121 [Rhizobiaceae bacterium]
MSKPKRNGPTWRILFKHVASTDAACPSREASPRAGGATRADFRPPDGNDLQEWNNERGAPMAGSRRRLVMCCRWFDQIPHAMTAERHLIVTRLPWQSGGVIDPMLCYGTMPLVPRSV